MTSPKTKEAEVLGVERRRRWSAVEKLGMVRETYEAGMSVSLVARKQRHQPEPAVPLAQARTHRFIDRGRSRRERGAGCRTRSCPPADSRVAAIAGQEDP